MSESASNPREQTRASIRADFDRLAPLLETDGWDHNAHYHEYLLRHLPPNCRSVLEIGCGTGSFSRQLAERSEKVLAIDLAPQMIRVARERSEDFPNIDFQVADAVDYALGENRFDAVATLTTLHHLAAENVLRKISRALRPGGTFLCLDLYRRASWRDALFDAAAFPASLLLRLMKTGSWKEPKALREAYAAHGATDVYSTLPEIRRIAARLLPGAKVKRHLLWRYSVIWKKPFPGDS